MTSGTPEDRAVLRDSNAVVEVAVTGLFGKFDYTLALGDDRKCLILFGANGVGKTVILRMLHALFASDGDLLAFAKYPFRTFAVTLADQTVVVVTPSGPLRLRLVLAQPNSTPIAVTIALPPPEDLDGEGEQRWFDLDAPPADHSLELVGLSERLDLPAWLTRIRESTRVRLIETDRTRPGGYESVQPDPVGRSAADLATQLGRAATEYLAHAQSLDRTFPLRFLEGRHAVSSPADLPARLEAVLAGFDRMQRIGLLASTDAPVLSVLPDDLEEHKLRFLSLYADDARQKLEPINDFAERVELFVQQVHDWLDDKTITITPRAGFVIHDKRTRDRIPFQGLSSGERHLLVMWHELLFSTPRGALVLIDEPEISWHVSWQKRFLDDLLRVSAVVGFTTIIATHSPFIPGEHLDLTFPLGQPVA